MMIIVPSYSEEDFPLTGGLSIQDISVTSDGIPRNNLVTYMEEASVRLAAQSTISHRRLNHQDFAFNIVLNNPEAVTRKVIVRIFLSLAKVTEVDGVQW